MLTALLLIAALATPADKELPKYWNEYPDSEWTALLAGCLEAGKRGGYDDEKMQGYCVCHLWTIIEITPYKSFIDMRKQNALKEQFDIANQMCASIGYTPGKSTEKKTPKKEPKPANPLKSRPGTSVT